MAKRKGEWGNAAIQRVVKRYLKLRDEYLKDVANIHVRLVPGNSKTGVNCRTASLLPIIDCPNCSGCRGNCYDVRHDCIQNGCVNLRAQNSAIHLADPARYWQEIDNGIKAEFVTELRLNVGGDLTYDDFCFVAKVGNNNKGTDILFFTKNYDGCNHFIDNYIYMNPDNFGFPSNVHPIYSRWEGMEINNPHHVPESHVLWENGDTTAPEFGAYYCGGNCSACHFYGEGCWTLKANEHVVFNAH